MQTFIDSIPLAKGKMFDKQFVVSNSQYHLSDVTAKHLSEEILAKPNDTSEKSKNLSSVHFSLDKIEEDDNFVKPDNE